MQRDTATSDVQMDLGKNADIGSSGLCGPAPPMERDVDCPADPSTAFLLGVETECDVLKTKELKQFKTRVKLIDYIHRQRQCKLSVPLSDRTAELNSYPRFNDWLDIVNVRKEVVQRIPEELTLDALLEMNESKVKETMKRCGARDEECSRLNGALSCLRKVTESGELKDDVLVNLPEARRDSSSSQPDPAALPVPRAGTQPRSVSVSTAPPSEPPASHGPSAYAENLLEPLVLAGQGGRLAPRTHSITITPPATPQARRRHKLKPPRTPPPPCRKVFQLLPNFPTLTRSKSHESQLGNRIDEVPPIKFSTKSWLSQICQVCQKSMMFGVKLAKIRRTESVPSDINNPVDRPTEPQFGTLPKALTKKVEEPETNKSEPEDDEDEVEDLPNRRPHLQGMIYRKPSQTSVYLQEWDIPFEQIELGDPIGQGRWGKVYKGKWHGEVAIRLLEIDGNNQDHLKLFKKEVMNYRQTRHENVVLFMGACMNPPHLAIITSFCKGRTLHSFVRDPKISLDINKTRQIAQEIIKGMGYLHAKGIVHKDLKSKNVFYDNGKVVITDFGLFGISGVVQEGRRENELKLPHDWLCYLAPEIVREMAPGKDEDKLPFSKAADIYAFGTVWYELQAREWPFRTQPAEALIWQIGSGEGVRQVLATVSLGKEVNEILSACWAFDLSERPSFTVLMEMLEKLPKLNRRLSHPGHFWKSAE
ncbi:hypothetical protein BTVI_86611 [Pitangus sulphuratus]|nr:hypothetical protein BTVI_86611 [Pitangus sulphuratus]